MKTPSKALLVITCALQVLILTAAFSLYSLFGMWHRVLHTWWGIVQLVLLLVPTGILWASYAACVNVKSAIARSVLYACGTLLAVAALATALFSNLMAMVR
jgi:hypothetical protein